MIFTVPLVPEYGVTSLQQKKDDSWSRARLFVSCAVNFNLDRQSWEGGNRKHQPKMLGGRPGVANLLALQVFYCLYLGVSCLGLRSLSLVLSRLVQSNFDLSCLVSSCVVYSLVLLCLVQPVIVFLSSFVLFGMSCPVVSCLTLPVFCLGSYLIFRSCRYLISFLSCIYLAFSSLIFILALSCLVLPLSLAELNATSLVDVEVSSPPSEDAMPYRSILFLSCLFLVPFLRFSPALTLFSVSCPCLSFACFCVWIENVPANPYPLLRISRQSFSSPENVPSVAQAALLHQQHVHVPCRCFSLVWGASIPILT